MHASKYKPRWHDVGKERVSRVSYIIVHPVHVRFVYHATFLFDIITVVALTKPSIGSLYSFNVNPNPSDDCWTSSETCMNAFVTVNWRVRTALYNHTTYISDSMIIKGWRRCVDQPICGLRIFLFLALFVGLYRCSSHFAPSARERANCWCYN